MGSLTDGLTGIALIQWLTVKEASLTTQELKCRERKDRVNTKEVLCQWDGTSKSSKYKRGVNTIEGQYYRGNFNITVYGSDNGTEEWVNNSEESMLSRVNTNEESLYD